MATEQIKIHRPRFTVGLTILSVILFGLLVSLGEKALSDLKAIPQYPEYTYYAEKYVDATLQGEIDLLRSELSMTENRLKKAESEGVKIREEYLYHKDILDASVDVKKAKGIAGEKEAQEKDEQLEESRTGYIQKREELLLNRKLVSNIQDRIDELNQQIQKKEIQQEANREKGRKEYEWELRKYQSKVFFLRIGFILPVVALGIYLFLRAKRGKYAVLIYTYMFFALVMALHMLAEYVWKTVHFYGVYSAGALIVGGTIVLAIRSIHRPSREKLLKGIKKMLAERRCPNCGWRIEVKEGAPYYCPSCGLAIYDKCPECREIKHALLPYCSQCNHETTIASS
jgi:predicted RNA-binding Zn-ribbon protein involved in translation (DUF1610 family)